MRQLFSLSILLISLNAQANWTCAESFSEVALSFYKHLFNLKTDNQSRYFKSVKYLGEQADGRIGFRLKKPFFGESNWSSMREARLGTPTPQGDIRNFIFIAGPRLASKFGFEFREDQHGVTLLVPTAPQLEKIIRKLNAHLMSKGQEPISYLPKRSGFTKKGEGLELAIGHSYEDGIAVQFPFADLDRNLAAHEVSFHLGSILFPQSINLKADAINREVDRIAGLLRASGLPRSKGFADWLVATREFENDYGNGNLQDLLAKLRNSRNLKSFSEIAALTQNSLQWARNRGRNYVAALAAPHYTPREHVIRKLLKELGAKNFFSNHEKITEPQHEYSKNGLNDLPFFMIAPRIPTLERYNEFIRGVLAQPEAPQVIPARKSAGPWLIEIMAGLDQRIRELNDAFDAMEE